jgi:hypothetical protein
MFTSIFPVGISLCLQVMLRIVRFIPSKLFIILKHKTSQLAVAFPTGRATYHCQGKHKQNEHKYDQPFHSSVFIYSK